VKREALALYLPMDNAFSPVSVWATGSLFLGGVGSGGLLGHTLVDAGVVEKGLVVLSAVLLDLLGLLELGPLLGEDGVLLLGARPLLEDLVPDAGLLVGVELDHDTTVLQGVLLLVGAVVATGLAQVALDLVGGHDAGEIGVGHEGARESEVGLLGRGLVVGAVDGVEPLEGVLGPDDEAAEVTTRGELEEVQALNAAELNAGDVPTENSNSCKFKLSLRAGVDGEGQST
jgi:hypothetical protein